MKNGDIKPDTHCFDEDEQKDVWSYSEALVAQIRAEDQARIRELEEALEAAKDGIDAAISVAVAEARENRNLPEETDRHPGGMLAARKAYSVICSVASRPSGYSALNEALARECERLADWLERHCGDATGIIDWLRNEADAHRAKGGV